MKKSLLFMLPLILFSLPLYADNVKNQYHLLVEKKTYTLKVIETKSGTIVKTFPITLGKNPGKKQYFEDDKTPEGTYYIKEILSFAADKNTQSYKKLSARNKLYWKAKDGHHKYGKPEQDLGDNAYGPRFLLLSYPNDEDKRNFNELKKLKKIPSKSRLGWNAIHGTNDPASIGRNASSGCVRLLKEDIVQLDPYIGVGTKVIISGE